MLASNAPAKISTPFANSGTKNTIPVPSQISVTPGAASFTDGFPPLTMTPVASGGVPPYGADFNGILNAITAIQQFQSAGYLYPFDATFATNVTGYPKGALVTKATGIGFWVSLADANTTNPDSAVSANWCDLENLYYALDTGAANAYAATFQLGLPFLFDGLRLRFKATNANTGACTFNPNGLGAKQVLGGNHSALQGGEIIAGGDVEVVWNTTLNGGSGAFVLLEATGGALQVAPATQSQHAMQYGQATGRLLNVQVFTASGTYTPTTGMSTAIVEVQGGGGGGGGTPATSTGQAAVGSGGNAGAYAKARLTAAAIGSSVTVTVGAAGTGVSGTNGNAGGTSSFGALVSCPGGAGGSASTAGTPPFVSSLSGNGSASPSGGNISNEYGGVGLTGIAVSVGNVFSGGGGTGKFGAGVNGIAAGAGANSSSKGSGGSGAAAGASTAAQAGGSGVAGLVIVWEYA